MEDFLTKVMVGLAIIGESSPQSATFVILGRYDLELKCAFYYRTKMVPAKTVQDLETPEVLMMLDRLKAIYRADINAIFEMAAKQDRDDLLKKLKETNKPHEMGTVSDIASKYGISKSEVRRRKADGTLSELEAK